MAIALWGIVLVLSLGALIKGADYFIKGAEEIGIYLKLSPFVIGVLLVGVGTSLPEFAGAVAALIEGTTEIITANAVGSNIANILLVVGIFAVLAKKIFISRDLLETELPLFVVSTALFIGIAFDGQVTFLESVMLAAGFVIYLWYMLSEGEGAGAVATAEAERLEGYKPPGIGTYTYVVIGLVGITVGARFLITSIVELSEILNVLPGVISLTAVAIGTSLPELFTSLSAIKNNQSEIAIGNIFGSNAFNILFTVGVPGLFGTLLLGEQTLMLGLPILAAASFIFLISGISRRIYRWEGMMFLVLYAFFLLKISGF